MYTMGKLVQRKDGVALQSWAEVVLGRSGGGRGKERDGKRAKKWRESRIERERDGKGEGEAFAL